MLNWQGILATVMAFGGQGADIFLNPRAGGQLGSKKILASGPAMSSRLSPYVAYHSFSLHICSASSFFLCSPAFSAWSPSCRAEFMTAQVSWGSSMAQPHHSQPNFNLQFPNSQLSGLQFWFSSLGQLSYHCGWRSGECTTKGPGSPFLWTRWLS